MKNTVLELKIHLADLAEQTGQNKRWVNLKKDNRNLTELKHEEKKKNLTEHLRNVGNTKWSNG